MRVLGLGLLFALATALGAPAGQSESEPAPLSELPSNEPTCGETFDTEALAEMPSTMLAWSSVARELVAAADCVRKGDIASACAHWRRLMEITDEMGPPLNQNRVGIETQMREHDCEPAAAAEPAELATGLEAEPGPEADAPPETIPVPE